VDEAEDRAEEALRVNGLGASMWHGPGGDRRPSVFTSARTTYLMEEERPVYGERCAASDHIYGISKLAGEYFVQQRLPGARRANGKSI